MKKGSVADSSSGKTSIFAGGTDEELGASEGGVNLKRARCLFEKTEISIVPRDFDIAHCRKRTLVTALWDVPILTPCHDPSVLANEPLLFLVTYLMSSPFQHVFF